MKTKSAKIARNLKPNAPAAEETQFVVNGRPLVLATPPEEIADDGEVRLGCSALDGRFPTFR